MASSQPFQLLASLQQEAAVGNADSHPLAASQPDEQAREARLAMRCQKVQIVVVASNAGAQFAMLRQVAAWSAPLTNMS